MCLCRLRRILLALAPFVPLAAQSEGSLAEQIERETAKAVAEVREEMRAEHEERFVEALHRPGPHGTSVEKGPRARAGGKKVSRAGRVHHTRHGAPQTGQRAVPPGSLFGSAVAGDGGTPVGDAEVVVHRTVQGVHDPRVRSRRSSGAAFLREHSMVRKGLVNHGEDRLLCEHVHLELEIMDRFRVHPQASARMGDKDFSRRLGRVLRRVQDPLFQGFHGTGSFQNEDERSSPPGKKGILAWERRKRSAPSLRSLEERGGPEEKIHHDAANRFYTSRRMDPGHHGGSPHRGRAPARGDRRPAPRAR